MPIRISCPPVLRSPQLARFWASSLAVTIALFYWLLWFRADVFDVTSVSIFWRLFMFDDYWAALAMIPILLLAIAPPCQRAAFWMAAFIGSHPRGVACAAFAAFAAGAYFVYHAHPLSMDEYAPWLQSLVFAEGRLTGQIPAELANWVVPAQFQNHFINVSHESGRIASVYWPAFALLLAPFSAAGVPWLLNPLIGGATLLVIHAVTRRLSGSELAAGTAVLLTLASQAFTINSMTFYSMSAHLFFNLLYACLLFEATPRRAFAAGVLGSIALTLHNPLPHLLFAIPWVLSALFGAADRRVFPALIAGYLPLTLVLGVGWSLLAASVFTHATDGGGQVDFFAHWLGRIWKIFSVPDIGVLYSRLVGLAKLWLWAVPGAVLLAVMGGVQWRSNRSARLLGWSALATFVGFLFVPFDQGHGWGFRYFHSAWAAVPILAALALEPASDRAARSAGWLADARPFVAACALLWLVVGTILRCVQVEGFISDHLEQLPRPEIGRVPVRIVNPVNGYYAVDLIQNDPFLRGPIVLVTQGRQRDAAMMARVFPDLALVTWDYRGQIWAEHR